MFKQRIKTILRSSAIGFVIFFISSVQAEMRDPTRPALFFDTGKTVQQDDQLTLSAIWSTATSKRATINGITVRQGDTILNNIKIVEIHSRKVIINQQGVIQKLSLLSKPIKNPLSTYHP